jgi:4-amino-4-deoxy-L-arabinose transferase-like glycosyltransferase
VAYLHVRDSHFGVTDVPMAALATWTLLCLHRAVGDPTRLRRWALAGVLAGLTASTKYSGGVLAAAGLVAAMIVARAPDEPWSARNASRRAATFLACALLGFIAGTPYALLAYPAFVEGLRFDSDHLVMGHGIRLGYGWTYHLMFTLRYGLGTPLLVASIAGIAILAALSWRKCALVCTFPILYYLLLGRGTTVFVRYMIPIVPFLCITAAVSVVAVANRLSPRSRERAAVISAAVAVLLALPSMQRVFAFDSLLMETDTRVLAARWLAARTQPTAWVSETPDRILHPNQTGLRIARFDAARHAFVSETNDVVIPEWIVVATSPLTVYTTVPLDLLPVIESSYSTAAAFSSARSPESSRTFDQQDKFFLPYAEFKARLRPGPDIRIYHRLPDSH